MGGEERQIFHPLAHSPDACDSWGWAVLKPKAQNPIQFPLVGGRNPSTGTVTYSHPGCTPPGNCRRELVIEPRNSDMGCGILTVIPKHVSLFVRCEHLAPCFGVLFPL